MSETEKGFIMNTPTEKITLVMADDHLVVRQGLRAFLEIQLEIEIVGEAATPVLRPHWLPVPPVVQSMPLSKLSV